MRFQGQKKLLPIPNQNQMLYHQAAAHQSNLTPPQIPSVVIQAPFSESGSAPLPSDAASPSLRLCVDAQKFQQTSVKPLRASELDEECIAFR